MAGGEIGCGSFQGSDKSGSAFEAVLDALPLQARDWVEAARQQLDSADVVLLEVDHAQGLLPFLKGYQTRLIAEIGHDDWERPRGMKRHPLMMWLPSGAWARAGDFIVYGIWCVLVSSRRWSRSLFTSRSARASVAGHGAKKNTLFAARGVQP